MSIDLLSLEPHQVSRDLRGYSLLLYGDPKSGKTTIASQFPGALLLAFEKGYRALPGVMAQPMNTWADMMKVMKQLRKEEVKERFETIVIDTGDLAYDACEKHVCNLHGVAKINEIAWGGGYAEAGRLLDAVLQELARLGYGVIVISHADDKTLTDEQGNEFQKIQPTLAKTPRRIITRFCDIIGYSRIVRHVREDGTDIETTYLYMRGTIRFEAGSRFRYTPDAIEFSYQNLVNAIADAVDKEAAANQNSVTDRIENVYTYESKDYDTVMERFVELTGQLMQQNAENQPKIESIIESIIGKGRKVSQLDKDSADAIDAINEELAGLLE